MPNKRLRPPTRLLALILVINVVELYLLTRADEVFKAMGLPTAKLGFIAMLAALVSTPAGVAISALLLLAWFRFVGRLMRAMMRCVPEMPETVPALIEPLVILVNGAFIAWMVVSIIRPMMTVCYTWS